MASTYTTSNKLDKQGVGDNSTTWGVVLNTDLNLIDSSLDAKTSVALAGTTSTMTLLDGAASDIRSRVIVFTGALGANHTVTVAPNTMPKWWIMKNQTTGGFSVIITQGSGGNATIPASNSWAFVIADGAGSGAAVVTVDSPSFSGTVTGGTFSGSGASLTSIPPSGIAGASHVRAKTSTAQSLPDSTQTLIVFPTEDYDTQGEYNTGTGRFTAVAAGYYRVTATIRVAAFVVAGTKTFGLSVYKNGSAIATSPGIATDSSGSVLLSASVDTTLSLVATDYVEVFAQQVSGASRVLDGSSLNNFLCIDRLV